MRADKGLPLTETFVQDRPELYMLGAYAVSDVVVMPCTTAVCTA